MTTNMVLVQVEYTMFVYFFYFMLFDFLILDQSHFLAFFYVLCIFVFVGSKSRSRSSGSRQDNVTTTLTTNENDENEDEQGGDDQSTSDNDNSAYKDFASYDSGEEQENIKDGELTPTSGATQIDTENMRVTR